MNLSAGSSAMWSFSPLKAKLPDFDPVAGARWIDRWGGSKTEIDGFLNSLAATFHEAVPLFAGWAITEGPIEAAELVFRRQKCLDTVPLPGFISMSLMRPVIEPLDQRLALLHRPPDPVPAAALLVVS